MYSLLGLLKAYIYTQYDKILPIVVPGGGSVQKYTAKSITARSIAPLLSKISAPAYLIVPDVEKIPELYEKVRKAVEDAKQSSSIFVVDDILQSAVFLFHV